MSDYLFRMSLRDIIDDFVEVTLKWSAVGFAVASAISLGVSIFNWLKLGRWDHPSALHVASFFVEVRWVGVAHILDSTAAWVFFAALSFLLWAMLSARPTQTGGHG